MMLKKFLQIFCVFFVSILSAQEDTITPINTQPRNKVFLKDYNMRVSYIHPYGIGDNFIAKANEGRLGFGFKLSFFSVYRVHFGIAAEFLRYDVSNPALAANVERTGISSASAEFMYEQPITTKLTFMPKIGVGPVAINQSGMNRYGSINGVKYAAGIYCDYKIIPTIEVFLGIEYSHSNFDLETAAEYQSFFSNVNQLNAAIGLKFNFNRY